MMCDSTTFCFYRDKAREQEREIERLRTECNEQARLLGISGSREAKLMADIETLRKELAEANSFIESLANACQAAEARAIKLQSSLIRQRGKRDGQS